MPRGKSQLLFATLCALCAFASNPTNATSADKKPVFEQDVLPIFTKYCFNCHGKSSPQLGLDLRSARLVMRGSQNGRVVVPGSLEKSLLWKKVSTREMPLKQFKLKLSKAEIDVIRRWILAGAPSSKTKKLPPAVRAQFAYYETRVKPILKRRCVSCHGKDEPEGGLDLRSLESLLRGGKHGPVIVEGFSDKSVLIRKVAAKKMPPPDSGQPLTAAEIRTITHWIDKGKFADYVDVDRKDAEAEQVTVTEKDRKFWAFQKPVAKSPPQVKGMHRVRTPIDRFVLARLEAKGLTFSPDASKRTLLRRAYFDLTGLPPTPEQAREFLDDKRPDAWERLIDRLLASPQYGERWGRHWLDVVGYVDTSGKDFNPKGATLSPGYWRYRDYVIKATNKDTPWDRFFVEQIAGDELVDWRNAKRFTPRIRKLLTATGFLRNVLDATNEDISNLPFDRYEALFKLMERVGSSTMGLTLNCARCHSHKFDPIPQTDYYRFLALFTAAYNPTKWLPPKKRFLYDVSKAEQAKLQDRRSQLGKTLKTLKKQLALIAKRKDAKSKKEAASLRTRIRAIESELKKLQLEKLQALWDVGPAPTIRLLHRGDVDFAGPKVRPGFLTVLSPEGKSTAVPSSNIVGKTTGLRLAFAEWLTHPDHPLTSRVIVNRLWQHHFGRGIVSTPGNFGTTGARPTHPQLLDWLAVEFQRTGWSAKRFHKLVMTSTVYRQSSKASGGRKPAGDPDNQLLSRMALRRLDAEALRDAVLAVSGQVNTKMGGEPVKLTSTKAGLQTLPNAGLSPAAARRSIYVLARRSNPMTFLRVFDYPVIDVNCTARMESATPLQSLTMLNSKFLIASAGHLVDRIDASVGTSAELSKRIRAAYEIALCREPSNAEVRAAVDHVQRLQKLYAGSKTAQPVAERKAFQSFCHMLICSNEFLYVD